MENNQIVQNENRLFIKSPTVENLEDKECSKDNFTQSTEFSAGYLGKAKITTHKRTNIQYCIKIAYKSKLKDYVNIVNDQLTLMYKINHPFFYRLLNHFEDKENLYLIFPYTEKGYSNILKEIKEGRLNGQLIKKYFHEAVIAVDYLHKMICYNSLEPEYIMLNNNHINLTDYGWNKISRDRFNSRDSFKLRNGYNINAYTPPELFDANKKTIDRSRATKKSDIWELGVLLYEMITKINPFNRKADLQEFIYSIIEAKVDYSLIPKEYNVYKDLIMKMLQTNPDKRIDIDSILNMPLFKSNIILLPEIEKEQYIINKKKKPDYKSEIEKLKKKIESFQTEIALRDNTIEGMKKQFNERIVALTSENRKLEFAVKDTKNEMEKKVSYKDKEINELKNQINQIENEQELKFRLIESKISNYDDLYSLYLPLIDNGLKKTQLNTETIYKGTQENYQFIKNTAEKIEKNYRDLIEEIKTEIGDLNNSKNKNDIQEERYNKLINEQREYYLKEIRELKETISQLKEDNKNSNNILICDKSINFINNKED